MDELLPYYEQELMLMRRDCAAFAQRYPRLAGELGIAEDGCKDPGVERLIQSFSLVAARIAKRLDDDYPQFTASLLETLYPHYLRTFPSCSIVQAGDAERTAEQMIPRGTVMKADEYEGVRCKFSTAYALHLTRLTIAQARFAPFIHAPLSIRLAEGVGAAISITLSGPVHAAASGRLRIFLDGEASFCAALRDTLFMRVRGAYVSVPEDAHWHALEEIPLHPVGFAEDEALIPFPARSHPAYRLLTEYFAFPEKFNFIDLDLGRIAAAVPAGSSSLTLHLALAGIAADSALARTLSPLSAAAFRLHCTPVANLFQRSAPPVKINHTAADYSLLADTARPAAYEIHHIVSAQLLSGKGNQLRTRLLRPFYGRRHDHGDSGNYWITRRDNLTASCSPGHELRVALVGEDLAPLDLSTQTLSAELICSNRDLPSTIPFGNVSGDLRAAGLSEQLPLRLLRKPSRSQRFGHGNDAHWRLISHLTLNHRSLSEMGLEKFKEMLTLYNLPNSAVTQRQIQGLTALTHRMVQAWIRGPQHHALMPGIEVRMTLDEAAFVGSGIHAFISVIDHFLGLYTQINVFSRLIVVSKHSGEELYQCPARSGNQILS